MLQKLLKPQTGLSLALVFKKAQKPESRRISPYGLKETSYLRHLGKLISFAMKGDTGQKFYVCVLACVLACVRAKLRGWGAKVVASEKADSNALSEPNCYVTRPCVHSRNLTTLYLPPSLEVAAPLSLPNFSLLHCTFFPPPSLFTAAHFLLANGLHTTPSPTLLWCLSRSCDASRLALDF